MKGVGARRSALFERLGVRTLSDLLYFFPRRYEDRRNVKNIADLEIGVPAALYVFVESVRTKILIGRGKRLTKAKLSDDTGLIEATWFNRRGLERILTKGTKIALYGVPSCFGSLVQMTEPDFEVVKDDEEETPSFVGIIPIYPSTDGLTQRYVRTLTASVVKNYKDALAENLPKEIIEKNKLTPISDAISEMHSPRSPESWKEARRRLAYEELFELQAALAATRRMRMAAKSFPLVKGDFYDALLASLPFELTASQQSVIDEIFNDARAGRAVSRLVQGDVGSGKTVAALAFAAGVCDGGAQCAVLAPTEVLAEQLYAVAEKYLGAAGVKCALLKSKTQAKERAAITRELKDGSINVVVGTHALLSKDVSFGKLGGVVIDEQQRFGVRQRAELLSGSPRPHLIMTSATPIPRTTALVVYGDLDISVIKGRPAGRRTAETRIIGVERLDALLRFIARETNAGGRAYWICPRVEDEAESDLPAAEKRFKWLSKKLPPTNPALVHGQMTSEEKEAAIAAFRSGASKLLVGTTVLEVGIDVPEATVIVIESPERYGLSQLHQMRGRVGRGKRRGVCVLLSHSLEAASRLRLFAATDDGFAIARADLALRGAGEITGTLQHGVTPFRVADLAKDLRLAEKAREDAEEFIKKEGEAKKYLKRYFLNRPDAP